MSLCPVMLDTKAKLPNLRSPTGLRVIACTCPQRRWAKCTPSLPGCLCHWTSGAAGAESAFPAAAAQDRGYFKSGPAAVYGRVGPAVPERLGSLGQVGVVAVGVPPATFRRVGRSSVELDADAVFVQVVQVPGPAAVPSLGLTLRCGKTVSPFHAVDVVAFQRRVDAVCSVLDRGCDP